VFTHHSDLPSALATLEKGWNWVCYSVQLGTPFSKCGSVVGCALCIFCKDVFKKTRTLWQQYIVC